MRDVDSYRNPAAVARAAALGRCVPTVKRGGACAKDDRYEDIAADGDIDITLSDICAEIADI